MTNSFWSTIIASRKFTDTGFAFHSSEGYIVYELQVEDKYFPDPYSRRVKYFGAKRIQVSKAIYCARGSGGSWSRHSRYYEIRKLVFEFEGFEKKRGFRRERKNCVARFRLSQYLRVVRLYGRRSFIGLMENIKNIRIERCPEFQSRIHLCH